MPRVEIREIHDDKGRRIGEAEYADGEPHGKSRVWTPEGILIQEATSVMANTMVLIEPGGTTANLKRRARSKMVNSGSLLLVF